MGSPIRASHLQRLDQLDPDQTLRKIKGRGGHAQTSASDQHLVCESTRVLDFGESLADNELNDLTLENFWQTIN